MGGGTTRRGYARRVFRFDRDTELTAGGPGVWRAPISPAWDIGDNPNGGYAMALGLSALGRDMEHPHPLTATAHYLRPLTSGAPAECSTDVLRQGRSVSTGVVAIRQEGIERVRILATFTDLAVHRGPSRGIEPPELPDPDDCVRRGTATPAFRLTENLDIALDPDDTSATVRGWIRFEDDRPPDLLALPLMADSFPPTAHRLGVAGWVPTVELTVHFHAEPACGWVQGSFRPLVARDGLIIEDGTLWDASGTVVATSRQLAKALG